MQELDKYAYQPVQGEVVDYVETQQPGHPNDEGIMELVHAILRRWYIVFFCAVLVGGGGVVAVWRLMPEKFDTKGSVLISPVVAPIMYETEGKMSNYDTFKNTQAGVMTSDMILNRVADEVKDKKLLFFSEQENLLQALRVMVVNGDSGSNPGTQYRVSAYPDVNGVSCGCREID